MGRNDLCFCGSGKKLKKCHLEIDEKSMIANLLKLYNKIDNKITDHYLSTGNDHKCKKGCAECCYNQTRISEIEYNLIQYELLKWSESSIMDLSIKVQRLWNILKQKHPELIKQLETSRDGQMVKIMDEQKKIFDFADVECPFLDLSTNTCSIYNVRPLVCRTFGVTYQSVQDDGFVLCKNLNIDELKEFGCDISEFREDAIRLLIWENGKEQRIYIRPLPLIYHLYKSFNTNQGISYINNFIGKFQIPESTYKQAIFNRISN